MNKLTKIGVSALCGSLASVSTANAGTLEVLGGATATYSSHEGQVTGNPIGMNSGMTFKGSGELDNGTTFTLTITAADQDAYSAGSIAMTTPSMGGIKINGKAGGTGIDRYDDMMPTAWEETNGTSLGTGLVTVAGVGTAMNIEWTAPADTFLPSGMTLGVAVAPGAASGATTNDKGVGGDSGGIGMGWDISIGHTGIADGLNLFAGYSQIEQANGSADKHTDDRSQYVVGATYAIGSVTLGYQHSMDDHNATSGAVTQYYENTAYGISFAVNDDLTLSYGSHDSERGLVHNGTTAPVEVEAESVQLSYTVGGMAIKFAESSVDNASYTAGTAADWDGRTIALTLAF
jgi:outer membrane protein OmpU